MSTETDKAIKALRRSMRKLKEQDGIHLSLNLNSRYEMAIYKCLWEMYKDAGGAVGEEEDDD